MYNQAVLELATKYLTLGKLVGRKKELYGQGRSKQVTGMQTKSVFGQ